MLGLEEGTRMRVCNYANGRDMRDIDKIIFDDRICVGNTLEIKVLHSDRASDIISCNHTYNASQIEWFRAGSALNLIKLESN